MLALATNPGLSDQIRLPVPAEAVVDLSGNRAVNPFQRTIDWTPGTSSATLNTAATKSTTVSGYIVVVDNAAPEIFQVLMRSDRLEVELTEEVNLTTAGTAISLSGQPTTWQAGATLWKLRTADPMTVGADTLEVDLDAFFI